MQKLDLDEAEKTSEVERSTYSGMNNTRRDRKYERARSNQTRCKTPYTTETDMTISSLATSGTETNDNRPLAFTGVAGAFINQINDRLGYTAPVNSTIYKTPVGTVQYGKKGVLPHYWPRVGNVRGKGGTDGLINMGDSLLKSSIVTNVLDTSSSSLKMMVDYGENIVTDMADQDDMYHARGDMGRPDYLTVVQAQHLNTGGSLRNSMVSGTSLNGSSLGSSVGSRRFGTSYPIGLNVLQAQSASMRTSSRASSRGSTVSGGAVQSFQSYNNEADLVRLKDVMKGIDYICQIIAKETYSLETQYLACSLFHRFLSICQIKKTEIRLLSGVCIFVATKFEENYGEALGSTAICAYFANTFTIAELRAAELRFLELIDWKIGVSSLNPRAYLRPIFRDLGLTPVVCLLASYLSELTLLDPRFLRYRNFEIAMASVELAVLSEYSNPLQVSRFLRPNQDLSNALGRMFFSLTSTSQNTSGPIGASRSSRSTSRQLACRDDLLNAWKDSYKGLHTTQIYKKYSERSYYSVSEKIVPFDNVSSLIDQIAKKLDESSRESKQSS